MSAERPNVLNIPNLKSELHLKFVGDQKKHRQELAKAQEELSRLEAEADGIELDSDTSSLLSSVDDALEEVNNLPGINCNRSMSATPALSSRGMSATPAPSSRGSLKEDDKLEQPDIGADLKGT